MLCTNPLVSAMYVIESFISSQCYPLPLAFAFVFFRNEPRFPSSSFSRFEMKSTTIQPFKECIPLWGLWAEPSLPKPVKLEQHWLKSLPPFHMTPVLRGTKNGRGQQDSTTTVTTAQSSPNMLLPRQSEISYWSGHVCRWPELGHFFLIFLSLTGFIDKFVVRAVA